MLRYQNDNGDTIEDISDVSIMKDYVCAILMYVSEKSSNLVPYKQKLKHAKYRKVFKNQSIKVQLSLFLSF